jgi:thioredoxin reductase
MNILADIVIIGDSDSGHNLLDTFAKHPSRPKVAFISKKFKSTTTNDYAHVQYFGSEVNYIGYRQRLFCCYLKNGDNIFSTHLIIASGLNYAPLMLGDKQVPCVFNALDETPKHSKEQPALVLCNRDSDAKFAIEVAKKYKQVYLCTSAIEIAKIVNAATVKKLARAENIAVLPNTSIVDVVTDRQGNLLKVVLDNYSEITCAAIYAKTDSKPALDFVPKKIVDKADGLPVVNESCESTLVPCCFVVGTCLPKYTKAMEQKMIDKILKDF